MAEMTPTCSGASRSEGNSATWSPVRASQIPAKPGRAKCYARRDDPASIRREPEDRLVRDPAAVEEGCGILQFSDLFAGVCME
jgi:hypothetical protein